MEYKDFIKAKIIERVDSGFDILESDLNNNLFDFQKFLVKWALKKGKSAIFAECGLGKTIMQLEWAHQVNKFTNMPVLIIAPLAVSGQTICEGKKFGIEISKYIDGSGNIVITNYEQLENVDTDIFGGVVLDESSILKNFNGKLRGLIIDKFKRTPYKLACSATPSPNDPMELGNHSEFLNVMNYHEMLAMYFTHDLKTTQKWRIKGHGEPEFWKWVSSWAIMINNPKDIGFPDSRYTLPKLNILDFVIKTDKRDDGRLFNDGAISAIDFNAELRSTAEKRIKEVAEIVNNSKEPFIIWVKQNAEADLLRKAIPDAIEVRGDDTPEYKEETLLGFANGDFRVLLTKTKIAQFGLNFQNCRNQVFSSIDFSFEGTYQAIRRSYRFGQTKEVNIYLLVTDTMENVKDIFYRKESDFKKMQNEMVKYVDLDLNKKIEEKKIMLDDVITKDYKIMHGDCVQRIKDIPDNSVHFSIFSPPFADLYVYSNNIEDMGNSKTHTEFFKHFEFLAKELYRVMIPGRNLSFHCMNLPSSKTRDGFIGIKDFRGDLIRLFQSVGFIYHAEVTIWKDPVVAMQRTKAIGLLNKQKNKDATISRQGIPDYLVTMRKPGENPQPVTHDNEDIPIDLWQQYASPVWMDIDQGDTLQFRSARDNDDERHICPLQLGVIKRAIHLWTNKGDTVLTPFMGIGSEVFQANKMDRNGIGIELKNSYFLCAKNNLAKGQLENGQGVLF